MTIERRGFLAGLAAAAFAGRGRADAADFYRPESPEGAPGSCVFSRNDLSVASRVMGGINFVAFDNACYNVREEVIRSVKAAFEKPLQVVLLCHIPPFYTEKFLTNDVISTRAIMRGQGASEKDLASVRRGKNVWETYDRKTREFYTWIQTKSQLKAILCGHMHIAEIDGFSETARMYVAGGNYEGRAYDIVFK